MSDDKKAPVIVIKKITKGGGGHHGGAWKVAYADFVTAMMAFFLLMWLLNATTEEQRQGISEYFDPTPMEVSSNTSGAGGVMGGLTVSNQGARVNDVQPIVHNDVQPTQKQQQINPEQLAKEQLQAELEKRAATKADDVVTLLRPALAGPADVTIVGDISVDDAIAATAKTFGALKVENRPASTDVHIAPLAARNTPYVVTHSGRADQAFYGVYWPMPDYQADPALSYTADVASAILQSRLVDTVREKIGITYSPQVSSLASLQLPGQGYIGAAIETPEANFTAFRAILDQELAAMAAKPVSDDEFERALQPLIESATKRLENNEYWIGRLPLILRNPALKQSVTDEVSGLQAVSAAKVQDMIRRFVTVKKPLVVISKAK